MSLLGAILWVLGTVFYHLARRALAPPGNPRLDSTIAHRYYRRGVCDSFSGAVPLHPKNEPRSEIHFESGARVPGAHLDSARPRHALGTSVGGYPGDPDDHLDWCSRTHRSL